MTDDEAFLHHLHLCEETQTENARIPIGRDVEARRRAFLAALAFVRGQWDMGHRPDEPAGLPSDLDARAATYARNVDFNVQRLDLDQVWAEGVTHGRATPFRRALPRSNPMAGLLETLMGERPAPIVQQDEIQAEYTAAPSRALDARNIDGEGEDDLFARALATWPRRSFARHADMLNDMMRHVFDFTRSCTALPWQRMDTAPRTADRLFVMKVIRASEELRVRGEDVFIARYQAMESEAGGRPDRWEFVLRSGFVDRNTMQNWRWLDTTRMGSRPPEPEPVEPPPAPGPRVRRMAI